MALSATLLAVLLGTPAAYALARFEFGRKDDLWFWFISNRFISPVVIILPVYLLASQMKLISNPGLLIAMSLTFSIPVVVWICTNQFRSIPRELDEAAMVDGASPGFIFLRIALPLALPGVVVSSILSFIFNWNELLFALFLTRGDGVTALVRATHFLSGSDVPWGEIMATGTLIVLLVVIFSLLVSRHLVQGLTMGPSSEDCPVLLVNMESHLAANRRRVRLCLRRLRGSGRTRCVLEGVYAPCRRSSKALRG